MNRVQELTKENAQIKQEVEYFTPELELYSYYRENLRVILKEKGSIQAGKVKGF